MSEEWGAAQRSGGAGERSGSGTGRSQRVSGYSEFGRSQSQELPSGQAEQPYGATAPGLSQVQSQPYLPPPVDAPEESQGTYGGAYAGAPYGGSAPEQTNGLALAGAALSVIPLVGLVFSIVGLARAKALGGVGKTVATVGLVMSILFAAGWGVVGYVAATEVVNSTAVDPACVAAESAAVSMERALATDESALADAEASDDAGTVKVAVGRMVSDMETIKAELDEDVARAAHASVRAKLQALDADLGRMIADLRAAGNGDVSATDDLESLVGKSGADGQTIDGLCGNLTNG